jgi:solute:Na+ symporter, SSS family
MPAMPFTPSLAATAAATDLKLSGIGAFDIWVIAIYLVGVVVLGLYAGLVMKRQVSGGKGRGYFLAGGTLRWPMIGLALFATNISCVHLVSLAQSGFDTGFLNGNFEWMAAFTLVLLSLFFAPFYIRSKVATLPDFLEKRYSRPCRDMLAVFSMASAVIIHIGFSFLTGGIVIRGLFGIDLYVAITAIAALTALYTIVGGLLAVVLTEALQTVVLIAGAAVITWFAYDKLGGWDALTAVLAQPNALGETQLHKLSMLRPAGDPDGMPWYAVFLGYPVLGIWYWCADQTIVQRVLGAKDENHARVGPLFAAFIKIIPVFIFVLPGLLAFALFKTGGLNLEGDRVPGVVDIRVAVLSGELPLDGGSLRGLESAGALDIRPERAMRLDLKAATASGLIDTKTLEHARQVGEPVYDTKGVYTAMITQLLPTGLKGLLIAALLAALMSTVSGALNSISTLAAFDLYQRFRPEASDTRMVAVGRIAAAAALVVSIGLVPVLDKAPSIFNAFNDIIAHLAPPVTCVFLLGVFWKRANELSARWTLMIGSAAGVTVFALNKTGADTILAGIPFLMMAFYLLVFCIMLQVLITLASRQPVPEESARLCWASPLEPLRAEGWRGIGNYKVLAMLVVGVMIALYACFR